MNTLRSWNFEYIDENCPYTDLNNRMMNVIENYSGYFWLTISWNQASLKNVQTLILSVQSQSDF